MRMKNASGSVERQKGIWHKVLRSQGFQLYKLLSDHLLTGWLLAPLITISSFLKPDSLIFLGFWLQSLPQNSSHEGHPDVSTPRRDWLGWVGVKCWVGIRPALWMLSLGLGAPSLSVPFSLSEQPHRAALAPTPLPLPDLLVFSVTSVVMQCALI